MSADRVTDSLGRTWVLGAAVGRGSWGQSRLARAADGDREVLIKLPHGPDEVGAGADACASIARELLAGAQDAGGGSHGKLGPPRVEATVTTEDGRTGMVLPLLQTLEKRLEAGLPLTEALRIVTRIAEALAEGGRRHGNLKPSNVLLGERGELFLADPVTPTWAARPAAPRRAQGPLRGFLPPEADAPGAAPTDAARDSWALCQALWVALDPHRAPAAAGVDKVGVTASKDRAHAAFATEGSNPRFRGRVADRLGALLSRGLSAERAPSPPFRFESPKELAERLGEIVALVRPRVVDVGHLLPPSSAKDSVFQGDARVSFSVTVGSTTGVSDPDDLVCGLLVTDLDRTDDQGRPLRVTAEDATVEVVTHPSGRLRFQFGMPGIRPGRYRMRVAFAVKDGGDDPLVATGDFEVRPAPGYVPPAPEPSSPAALPFPRGASRPPEARPEEPLTDPGEEDAPSDAEGPAGVVTPLPRAPATSVGRVRESEPAPRAPVSVRAPLEAEATPISAITRLPRDAPSSTPPIGFPRPIAPPEEDEDDGEPPTVQVRRLPLVLPVGSGEDAPDPTFRTFPAAVEGASDGLGLDDATGTNDTEELLRDTEERQREGLAGVIPLSTARPPGARADLPTGPPASVRNPAPVVALHPSARPSEVPTVPPLADPVSSASDPGAAPPIAPPSLLGERPSEPGLEGGGGDLPGRVGEDLPGYGGGAPGSLFGVPLPSPVASALDVVRRDRTLSVGVAVALCLALVLVLTLVLKAC